MSIHFCCDECDATITARDELAGTMRRCPKCKSPVLVPAAVSDELDVFDEAFAQQPVVAIPSSPDFTNSSPFQADQAAVPVNTPDPLAQYMQDDEASLDRPSRALREKWGDLANTMDFFYLGTLMWCVSIGGIVLGSILLFLIVAGWGFMGALAFGTIDHVIGIRPEHSNPRSNAATGASIALTVLLGGCLRFIVATCDEYFFPFLAFVGSGLIVAAAALIGGPVVVAAVMCLGMLAAQGCVIWGWLQSLPAFGIVGKLAVVVSVVSLTVATLSPIPIATGFVNDVGFLQPMLMMQNCDRLLWGRLRNFWRDCWDMQSTTCTRNSPPAKRLNRTGTAASIVLLQLVFIVTAVASCQMGVSTASMVQATLLISILAIVVNGLLMHLIVRSSRFVFC